MFNYSYPTLVARQPALARKRDTVLLRELVCGTLWETIGALISKDRVK